MSASKQRPLWSELPEATRTDIERLVGGRVTRADSCPGGYSPGFASRLTLGTGCRVFVKAMDARRWPQEATFYRDEARIAGQLPATVPAPRLLGTHDDGDWVMLAFEHVEGVEPAQPWSHADLHRVLDALQCIAAAGPPAVLATLPRHHTRLGGWAEIARGESLPERLGAHSTWAADHLPALVELEAAGLAAARGDGLVHGDAYPHNILLAPDRIVFVDWPYAHLGAPAVDLVTVLSSVAADGIDPEPILAARPRRARPDAATVTAVLAAHAGFLIRGALWTPPPGLEPIVRAKLRLGLGALRWLRRRSVQNGISSGRGSAQDEDQLRMGIRQTAKPR